MPHHEGTVRARCRVVVKVLYSKELATLCPVLKARQAHPSPRRGAHSEGDPMP